MSRIAKLVLFLAVGLGFAVVPALAQVTDTAPIRVRAPKPRRERFDGYVLSSTRLTLTVRDRNNSNLVRTFSMSDRLKPRWERRYDSQPYQYGDHVTIHYLAGSDTAVKIKGRASRAIVGAGP